MIQMRQNITKLVLLCSIASLLGGCKDVEQAESFDRLLDGSLINAQDQPVKASSINSNPNILLYFSAHWCPPCQAFTPKLIEFYEENGGGQLFQIVFISSDHNRDAMLSYMRQAKMPWPAVNFRSPTAKQLQERYSGEGIPRLVLVNPAGDIMSDSFEGRNYLGPQTVLDFLNERLAEREAESAHPATVASGDILPTPTQLEHRFKITGFGRGSEQNIAIINEQFAFIGEDLGNGVLIENITEHYVEISQDGNRYRLTQ